MTISLKHAFQSAKGDPPDDTLVKPSDWNAEHVLMCATDRLLGRTSSGSGPAEEIEVSDFVQSLLNAADAAAFRALTGALNFDSGTVMLFRQTTPPTGWTKETSNFNNSALRVTTGAVSSGGSLDFTAAFASRTIERANLPNVALTVVGTVSTSITNASAQALQGVVVGTGPISVSTSPAVDTAYRQNSYDTILANSVFSNGITSSINGGVAQTAMNFAVRYVDVIFATKD